MGKQNKPGKVAATDPSSSKEYDSRTLEVAVGKVLQEDWTLYRASKGYKVMLSTLKNSAVKAGEHFHGGCNDLRQLKIWEVGRPFALSSDLELKFGRYAI
jgi:hypothetical protein